MALLILFALAAAVAAEECVVSDWSDWTPCDNHSVGKCLSVRDVSFQEPWTHDDSKEHRKMKEMMIEKTEKYEQLMACRKDGSCPELAMKASQGPVACVGGMAGSNPCMNVDQASFVNVVGLGGSSSMELNDIWGWTDPQTGDEIAVVGLTGGTSFVRLNDPENPAVLGFLPTATYTSNWRDMKVVNDHAFIVSEASNHGMQVFDLTRLRGLSASSSRRFTSDAWYRQVGNSHNIVGNEDTGYVYIVGATQSSYPNRCSGGLHAVDVSNPKSPTFAGCFSSDGYTHDAQCVVYHGPDTRYTGREICFNYNENTLTIVDVTSKSSMVQLSRVSYSGFQYTHQGWLTEDHSIALMDDELDESRGSNPYTRTLIWDVSDLRSPVLRNSFYSQYTSIDHNQYTNGGYTYQSNYEAGLQILRINQAGYDLVLTGSFDVFPSRTATQFSGTWSNYPYFKSGVIPVTSIEYGLYVLKPNFAAMYQTYAESMNRTTQERFRSVLFGAESQSCPVLKETRSCTQSC